MSFSDYMQSLAHFWPAKPTLTEKNYPDLTGKVFIVTGGPTGIGFEVSRLLASKNAKVWLVARSQTKIDAGIAKIKEQFPDAKLDSFLADYTDLATIKPGVQKFLDAETELHGVVHNAGVMIPPVGSTTVQGHDLQLGVNALGSFLLQKFLDELIIKTAKRSPENSVRIVWVSSLAHIMAADNKVGFDWLAPADKLSAWQLYGRSKAANVGQSILWPKYHADSGVVSLTLHPGSIRTELQRHSTLLTKFGGAVLSPAIYGAYTELFALLSPTLTTADNGAYIIPWGQIGFANQAIVSAMNGERGAELWKWMQENTKEFA